MMSSAAACRGFQLTPQNLVVRCQVANLAFQLGNHDAAQAVNFGLRSGEICLEVVDLTDQSLVYLFQLLFVLHLALPHLPQHSYIVVMVMMVRRAVVVVLSGRAAA